MRSFKNFLSESSNKGVVCAFARMNPSTIGHGLLVKKVIDEAKEKRCDHVIYLSKTQDKKKNPLDVNTKVAWAKKMFPGANIVAANEQIRTFIEMLIALNKKYKTLYLIAGSDRVPEYQKLVDKYNGIEFNFDKIEVISAGERDPDADGATGMSATKMRKAAEDNNLSEFKKGLPAHIHKEAQKMMDDVRKGMGL